MLFPMPGCTSWSSSDERRCSSQGVLPPVSTTPRHADFKGVTLDNLVVLEQVFSLNVYVYDLQETEAGDIAARIVRRSPYSYQGTMNLNLYEQHFSYVSNMAKYSHSFLCS